MAYNLRASLHRPHGHALFSLSIPPPPLDSLTQHRSSEIKTANIFICLGKALPQSNETTVIPDSTVRLNWTFAGDPSEASLVWFFTSRRVGSEEEEIAGKYRTRPVHISLGSLPGVAVELTPPTLVLKNVDERYNGIYRFSVQALAGGGEALVELYIAGMF